QMQTFRRALEVIESIQDQETRETSLAELVVRIGDVGGIQRAVLSVAASFHASSIDHLKQGVGRLTTSSEASRFLMSLLDAIIRMPSDNTRSDALCVVVSALLELPHVLLLEFVADAISTAAEYERGSFLSDMEAILPLIEKLGGEAAIREMCSGLDEVWRWW